MHSERGHTTTLRKVKLSSDVSSARVVFDRYLRDHTPHKGKQDLDRPTEPTHRSMLAVIRRTLHEALLNEKRDVPEHVEHPPFYIATMSF